MANDLQSPNQFLEIWKGEKGALVTDVDADVAETQTNQNMYIGVKQVLVLGCLEDLSEGLLFYLTSHVLSLRYSHDKSSSLYFL